MPNIFLQLVNANSGIFQYNAEMTELKIKMDMQGEDHGKKFMELSETLKVKPITITTLSMDDAIMIDHDDYEMM